MTFGAPAVGEFLAERYRLEQHISDDALGRQVWRGVDVVLRRPVAVVLRYPGGDPATEMISAAVAASRVNHSHLAGVYDAIDEGRRAYVVREWVNGSALRELVSEAPLDPGQAASVAYAIACAVSAVHATGMPHGNVTPGSVLLADDGRVVLTDAYAGYGASMQGDIRAIGGVLYCALTGHWPHAEAGPVRLPDAARDQNGQPLSPRQVRNGVPAYLSELTMDLLDRRLTPPTAEVLAAELAARFSAGPGQLFDQSSAMDFAEHGGRHIEPAATGRRKVFVGLASLVLVAVTIPLLVVKWWPGSAGGQPGSQSTTPGSSHTTPAGNSAPLPLTSAQIRVVDPPRGNRKELPNADRAIDQDLSTSWQTDHYNQPDFGAIKPGIGLLLDLGANTHVETVNLALTLPGATIGLRTGSEDPGADTGQAGDKEINDTFTDLGDPVVDATTTVTFTIDKDVRYLLVWISRLAPDGDRFSCGIAEIDVIGR
jgi:hypothetical protein